MPSHFKAPPSSFRHWCKIDEFSVAEINKLIKRQRSEKVTAEKSGLVCKKHTANIEALYLCNGPCNREQPASCYSVSTRKNGDYICSECSIWKGMVNRGTAIAAPGHQVSVDEIQETHYKDPALAYPMVRIELDLKRRIQGFAARRELPVPCIQGPGRYYVPSTTQERLDQGFDAHAAKHPEMVRHQYKGFVPPAAFRKEYEAMMSEETGNVQDGAAKGQSNSAKNPDSSTGKGKASLQAPVHIESKHNKKSQQLYIQEYGRWVDKKKPTL
ncbi:Stc1 domain protein [Ceratocystis lukuohia]|uniref:Stc1 domain protein n=2 Tax=Ceratocystis TaxID=5157 RepID=A0A0F8BVB2_CERFI|nr:Stc1 domain protein [Ceratocystis platani]